MTSAKFPPLLCADIIYGSPLSRIYSVSSSDIKCKERVRECECGGGNVTEEFFMELELEIISCCSR